MFRFAKTLIALSFISAVATAAHADTVTYNIQDIQTDTGNYEDVNVGQTYTGTGFVGLYDGSFGHLFGLEGPYSRTNLQVGIGGLAGSTISSAILSFGLTSAYSGGNLTITGYDTGGALGYQFNAPTATDGLVTGALQGASNSFDVTSLLTSALNANQDWLGLQLTNDAWGNWTYTFAGFGYNADSADVRLTVNYTTGNVPEPASIALLGLGLVGLAANRRNRKQ